MTVASVETLLSIRSDLYALIARVEDALADCIADPVRMDAPVAVLRLSVRPSNCLRRARIATIGELVSHSPDRLLALANFGETSLAEVRKRLREHGLALRDDRVPDVAESKSAGQIRHQ